MGNKLGIRSHIYPALSIILELRAEVALAGGEVERRAREQPENQSIKVGSSGFPLTKYYCEQS